MEPVQFVEATGETVEEAVQAGLNQLGVGPNDVLVEVMDEPTRGVFGIGAKPARVRLKLLRSPEQEEQDEPEVDESVDEDEVVTTDSASIQTEDQEELTDGEVAKDVLGELLDKMGLAGEIEVMRAEPSQPGEQAPWLVNVEGDDLNVLIGRRGETLASLQYIVRLIVSRRIQRRANVVVDVSGYKSRRSDRLEQLALRMADEAVKQERTISLEPMPPNERRIVHLTLRNRDDVFTESTGEGDSRKVTIVPK